MSEKILTSFLISILTTSTKETTSPPFFWNSIAVLRSPKLKYVQLILWSIMINNPVGLKGKHTSRINNGFEDKISRVYSKSNLPSCFESLFQNTLY